MNILSEKVAGYFTVKDLGVSVGYLLSLISIFLPWYSVSIYGKTTTYSGTSLASQFANFWILYLIPLVSGMALAGAIMYGANKKITSHPKVISLIFSIIVLAISFATFFITPSMLHTPLVDSMGIGGYTAITGGLTALIFTVFK